MELLFIYVKTVRGQSYDLEFAFNGSYKVAYNKKDKKIDIGPNDNSASGLFDKHITNINAVVGRNGVGKSTLLSLLGLQKIDRRFELSPAEWFAVYHLEDDLFAVEGYNSELLLCSPIQVEKDFIFYFNEKNPGAIYQWDLNAEKINSFKNQSVVLHFAEMKKRKPNFQDDANISFKRDYLLTENQWVYKYLLEEYAELDERVKHDHVKLFVPSHFSSSEISDLDNILLYEELDGFYTKERIYTRGVKNFDKIKNGKHLFILHMLEMLINEHMLLSSKDPFPDSIDQSIDKKIAAKFMVYNNNLYSGKLDDYPGIKYFLLNRLYEFVNIADDVHGIPTEMDWLAIVNLLEEFPENYFTYNNNECCLTITLGQYDSRVFDLLTLRSKGCIVNPFKIKFPEKSDGEFSIIRIMSSIYSKIETNLEYGRIKFLILIDEIDRHLHPEWNRTFLSRLLSVLHKYKDTAEFQIIMTTHSPYLISDLPKENILRISRVSDSLSVSHSNFGFGSNIYDIINDSFFLDSPIGEFANTKIAGLIAFIRGENTAEYTVSSARNVIDLIGDPLIKNRILQMFHSKFGENESTLAEIEKLEKRIAQLKKEL